MATRQALLVYKAWLPHQVRKAMSQDCEVAPPGLPAVACAILVGLGLPSCGRQSRILISCSLAMA